MVRAYMFLVAAAVFSMFVSAQSTKAPLLGTGTAVGTIGAGQGCL